MHLSNFKYIKFDKSSNHNPKIPLTYFKYFLVSIFFFLNLQLYSQLNAEFTVDKREGCGSLAGARFTDQSTGGNITSWDWRFGNGNSSQLQNPVASYTNIGNYSVTLIVSDGTQSDTITKTNYIEVYPEPTADFTLSPASGCAPLPVQFTNTSTSTVSIVNYTWDFGDGTQGVNGANPNHTYQLGGSYSPSLEIEDINGCKASKSVASAVAVTPAPQANFTTLNSPVHCSAPYTVNFQSNSTGSNLTYRWDFGDGNTSTIANPSHTYNNLGVYTVSLIVSDPNCTDTLTSVDLVRLENIRASFVLPKDTFCLGEKLSLTNDSRGASVFNWRFSDGSVINNFKPDKTLNQAGWLSIRLRVSSGPSCLDEYTDSLFVQDFQANFTTDSTFACSGDTVIFNASSSDSATYEWRLQKKVGVDTLFGDSIIYRGFGSGFYSDTLIATSAQGCVDSVIKADNREIDLILARMGIDGELLEDDTIRGCLPLSFNFQDSSISNFPIVSWAWDFDQGRTSTSRDTGSIDFIQRIIYDLELTVTNSRGCSSVYRVPVEGGEKQNPKFSVFPDSICQGDSITFVDSSTVDSLIDRYEYTLRGPGFNTILPSDTANAIARIAGFTGNFLPGLKVIDNGCDTTFWLQDSLHLKGPIAQPVISSDCINRNVVSFTANASDYTKFWWDFGDGSPLDSVNLNPTHTYNVVRNYIARLILFNDTNGCDTNIYDFPVPLGNLPTLRIRPDTMEYCVGDTIQFFNQDSIFYPNSSWYLNGSVVSTENTFNLPSTTRGTFPIMLEVTDFFGCQYRKRDTAYISQPQAKISFRYLDFCAPVTVEFTDSSTSDTTASSYWDFGNGITSTKSIDTIQLPANTQSSAFLKVTNIFGCSDSVVENNLINSSILTVDFRNGNENICAGDSIVFRNISTGQNPNFSWDFGDGTVLNSNAEFVSHTYTQGGLFDVTLTGEDQNGCRINETKTALANVNAIPQAEFTADTFSTSCPPLAVNFTDQSSGPVNEWRWKLDQNDASLSALQNPFKNYIEPGNYDVSLWVSTPNGCEDSILKPSYIQVRGPTADFTISPAQACIGDSVTFTASNGNNVQSYFWDFGDGNSANGITAKHAYDTTGIVFPSLILSDGVNCTVAVRDTFEIFNVFADFSISEDTACNPASIQFTNKSVGASTYTWSFGDGTSSTDFEPIKQYNQLGSYNILLTVNSAIGCTDTSSQSVYIAPSVDLSTSSDTLVCSQDSVTLQASGATSYAWSPARFLLDSTQANVVAFPPVDTFFTVIGNNAFNCPDTQRINVNVISPPQNITLRDCTIIIGENIQLNVFVGDDFNYRWTPPDGIDCPTCPNPTFSPLENTLYQLLISDPLGCFNLTQSFLLTVEEKFSLDVPQVFSPNGDGVNDIIYAKGWGLKELVSFKIYNRLGELVFESNDFNKGWDGTYKGKDQNVETYVYTVEALTFRDKLIQKKGNISLIR